MVVNKIDIGFLIKYELRFDDGVVSAETLLCCSNLAAGAHVP